MNFLSDIYFSELSYIEIARMLFDLAIKFCFKLVICVAIYWAGRKLIRFLDNLLCKILKRKEIDTAVSSFLKSLCNVLLTAALIIAIINYLGINSTSFVALLASAGIAMGMALSGTLQNFAGGVMILLFKPYRIGDYIEAQNQAGTVKEIQIFNTVLTTSDNRTIFIPNGGLSTGIILNYSNQKDRRVELIFSIGYSQNFDKAKLLIESMIGNDQRILQHPEPFIAIHKLNPNAIDIVVRVWTSNDNFWNVYFYLNEQIYQTFHKEEIEIPLPQLTVHLKNNV